MSSHPWFRQSSIHSFMIAWYVSRSMEMSLCSGSSILQSSSSPLSSELRQVVCLKKSTMCETQTLPATEECVTMVTVATVIEDLGLVRCHPNNKVEQNVCKATPTCSESPWPGVCAYRSNIHTHTIYIYILKSATIICFNMLEFSFCIHLNWFCLYIRMAINESSFCLLIAKQMWMWLHLYSLSTHYQYMLFY